MQIEFAYSKERDLGVIKLNGEKDFENSKEVWNKIRLLIENDHLAAALIHDNTTNTLQSYEVIEIAKWLSTINFPRTTKIAIIDPRPPNISNNTLGEIAAHNRSWELIHVFKNETAARNWLNVLS